MAGAAEEEGPLRLQQRNSACVGTQSTMVHSPDSGDGDPSPGWAGGEGRISGTRFSTWPQELDVYNIERSGACSALYV